MSIYWSLKNVPELALLPHKQRCQVHQKCLRRHFYWARGTVRSITALFVSILAAGIFVSLCISIPSAFGIACNFWFVLVSGLVGIEVYQFVFSQMAIPVLRHFYREFIEEDEKSMA